MTYRSLMDDLRAFDEAPFPPQPKPKFWQRVLRLFGWRAVPIYRQGEKP